MKQYLLTFFIFLFGLSVQAQMVTYSTDTVFVEGVDYDLTDLFEIAKSHAEIENVSQGELNLKWVMAKVDVPQLWQAQLCDLNSCYAFGQFTNIDANLNEPLVLAASGTSIMDIGVRHKGQAGIGIYKVEVSTVADPSTILTSAIYKFTINPDDITGTTTLFNQKAIKLFPNPVTGYFSLTDNDLVKQLQIFNIVGKKMMDMSFQNGDAINVASFPNGLYLVRMMGENGEVLRTTRMTKR